MTVSDLDLWVLDKQADRLESGLKLVLPVAAARGLPGRVVLANWPAIHLDALLVRFVFVVSEATVDTDVPDPKLPVAYGQPLTLNLENHSRQIGVRVLRQLASTRHIVEGGAGQLGHPPSKRAH